VCQRRAGVADHSGSFNGSQRNSGVRIKDPSLLLLIRRSLKPGYIDAGEFVFTTEGTPQGGSFSPILSNIFLHYVLDLWFEKKIKPRVKGACQLVRYADDYIDVVPVVVGGLLATPFVHSLCHL